MQDNLAALATEQSNPASAHIDEASSLEIVRLMNEEDRRVAGAVEGALPAIASLVDRVAEAFATGGRLFYVGAGTSGRLGTLDAVECPPTFGVAPEMVQGLMAGGPSAWQKAVEGAEDDEEGGARAIAEAGIAPPDICIGIAASGRTPFVKGALRAVKERGCVTGAISNHIGSEIGRIADVAVEMPVGPEVLTGSTRLKSGTAQKMALNMITTAAMIRIGKAYGNLMVDLQATNAKLRDRAERIVGAAAEVDRERAASALNEANGSAKLAIALLKLGCGREEAARQLEAHGGRLKDAIRTAGQA